VTGIPKEHPTKGRQEDVLQMQQGSIVYDEKHAML